VNMTIRRQHHRASVPALGKPSQPRDACVANAAGQRSRWAATRWPMRAGRRVPGCHCSGLQHLLPGAALDGEREEQHRDHCGCGGVEETVECRGGVGCRAGYRSKRGRPCQLRCLSPEMNDASRRSPLHGAAASARAHLARETA
jgi:hypothetical protein